MTPVARSGNRAWMLAVGGVVVFAGAGVVAATAPRSEPPLRFWMRLPRFEDPRVIAHQAPSAGAGVGRARWSYTVEGPRDAPRGDPIRGWDAVEWHHVNGDEGQMIAPPSIARGWLVRLGLRSPNSDTWVASRLVMIPTPSDGLSLWVRRIHEFPSGASPDPRAVGAWEAPDGFGGWLLQFRLEADGTCRRPDGPTSSAAGRVRRWAVVDDCLLIAPDSPPTTATGGPAPGTTPSGLPTIGASTTAALPDILVGVLDADRTECWRARERMLRRRRAR